MEEFPPTGLVDPDAFRRKTSNQRLPKIFSIEGIRVKEKKKKTPLFKWFKEQN